MISILSGDQYLIHQVPAQTCYPETVCHKTPHTKCYQTRTQKCTKVYNMNRSQRIKSVLMFSTVRLSVQSQLRSSLTSVFPSPNPPGLSLSSLLDTALLELVTEGVMVMIMEVVLGAKGSEVMLLIIAPLGALSPLATLHPGL